MDKNRAQLIQALFDTMDIAKRSMHGHMQIVLSGCTISRTQLELLFTIRHMQPVTSKELAQHLQLTPGAISQLTEGLDAQFLIKREVDPKDRRKQTLHISSQGTALLKAIEKRRRDVMEHVMQDLSDDELATWLRIQQKMINEFQQLHKQDSK
jgi:DNA-binding MarR family transcriptional regulator